MSYDTHKGISKLGAVISERARAVNKSPLILDFGMIQSDMSLKTDTYAKAIPRSGYSVCRQLTLGAADTRLTCTAGDGAHNHGSSGAHGGHIGGDGSHAHTGEGPHVHDVLIPENMRSILPGDRVLVAWVQNEAVVVDIITRI